MGKIGFLFTCGSYLSNVVFITVYAPFSAIDCSMLIGLPITPWEGLPKAIIDVFNWFNKRSKIEVTLGNVRAFDWENISVASLKARSSSTKILRRSHSSHMIKELPLPSLRQVVAIAFNTFLLSHAVIIMTSMLSNSTWWGHLWLINFYLTFYTSHIIPYTDEFFVVCYFPQEQVFKVDEELLQLIFVK